LERSGRTFSNAEVDDRLAVASVEVARHSARARVGQQALVKVLLRQRLGVREDHEPDGGHGPTGAFLLVRKVHSIARVAEIEVASKLARNRAFDQRVARRWVLGSLSLDHDAHVGDGRLVLLLAFVRELNLWTAGLVVAIGLVFATDRTLDQVVALRRLLALASHYDLDIGDWMIYREAING